MQDSLGSAFKLVSEIAKVQYACSISLPKDMVYNDLCLLNLNVLWAVLSMDWNCVCVGPTGSGKTLLLRSLLCPSSVDFTTSSAPTVGTSMKTIKLSDEKAISICELGGGIAPLWPSYYNGVSKVMFVVDVSNLCQISAAGVLLYSLLAEPSLRKAKLLLVLAKMDASYRQMRNEALLMLQVKRLQNEVPQEITIVQASSYSSEGLEDIKKWLQTE